MTAKPALFRAHPTTRFTHITEEEYIPMACWEIRCALDPEKMWAYDAYLEKYAKDKVIVDLGSGTGVMGYLALKHGAKKVIAIDYNEDYIKVVKKMLEPFGDRVEIGCANARRFRVPPCDIIIHEIFGHNIFDEYIAQISRNLALQGVLHKVVPKSIEWHTLQWQDNERSRADNALEYIPDNFPPAVQEFFKDYDTTIESVNDVSIQNIPMHDKSFVENYKIGECVGVTQLDNADGYNMVPPEIERVFSNNFANTGRKNTYCWFAYLDDKIGYGNYPRQGNNWAIMPADGNASKRFQEEVMFRENKNPLTNESRECQFSK
jgi:SAM-dependent methyltransferase